MTCEIRVFASRSQGIRASTPQAWLADVLARINDYTIGDLARLLPWNWCESRREAA